jgi:L-threonylcarbamoyladenylate synthase
MSLCTPEQALALLRQGEIVAVPTETVYGLAGRIDSESALQKIFATKSRPFFDPLIIHVADSDAARGLWREWPEIFTCLTERFWPGPLTLITDKRDQVSPLITSGLPTAAVRCPAHPLTLDLLRKLGTPFAAPSANRFGRTSPTSAQHVEDEFAGAVPVLDGGPCAVGVESTVLTAAKKGDTWTVKILRPGSITRRDLEATLRAAGFRFTLEREQSVHSPGHLKAHYQPESPVILLQDKIWSSAVQSQAEAALNLRLTGASELILPESPAQAARVLYEELRRLSRSKEDAIYVRRTSRQAGDDWEAIWDRLERAASVIF